MDNVFESIWNGISAEFSDLPSTESIVRLSVRLLIACFLGGLIGYERAISGKAAGVRTHMLVCLGTAFVLAIPQQAGMELMDISRVIQGVMAGVGFIGAGAIWKGDGKGDIEGLTTAASIWFTAAIGISIGLGREASALLGAVFVLGILRLIPSISVQKKKRQN